MRVLITGASGFIGTALTAVLERRDDEVVPLRRGSGEGGPRWDVAEGRIDDDALDGIDAVVHLAGESITPPWTASKKRRIMESRAQGTDLISRAVADAGTATLLSASGMDIYGDRGSDLLTESEPAGEGFMADVAKVWEGATEPAVRAGTRVVNLRSSLVLDASGGSLPKMMLLFRMFMGGPIGSGEQYWSWITLDDEVRAIVHCLDHSSIRGPVNLASPNPEPNRVFMKALGAAMGRPSWLRVPAFAPKLLLGAGAAENLLLGSKRLVPQILLDTGFQFAHPTIGEAMDHATR